MRWPFGLFRNRAKSEPVGTWRDVWSLPGVGAVKPSTPEAAYQLVSWVQMAITAIVSSATRVPLLILQAQRAALVRRGIDPTAPGWSRKALDEQIASFGAIEPWLLLQNPLRDNSQTWLDLFEQSLGWYLLRGRIVWWCPLGPSGKPVVVRLVAPQYCQSRINHATGKLEGYTIQTVNGLLDVPQEEVVEIVRWNPSSPFDALSPLSAGLRVANADFNQVAWQEGMAERGFRQIGVLTTDQDLDQEQCRAASETFSAKYGGAENAWRVPVLGSGLKWQDAGLTPKEAQWLEARVHNARELGALFGVPPIFLGDYGAAQYKVETQRALLWENAVLPLLRRFKLMLDSQFLPYWGDGLLSDWDLSGIEALKGDPETQAQIDATYLDRGVLSPAEVRQRTFGLPAYVGAHQIWRPLTQVPAGDTQHLEPARSIPGVQVVRAAAAALRDREREKSPRLEVNPSAEALARYYRQHWAQAGPQLKRLSGVAKAHSQRLVNAAREALGSGQTDLQAALSIDRWTDELADKAQPLVKAFYVQWGEQALAVAGDKVAKSFNFNEAQRVWLDQQVRRWARETTDSHIKLMQDEIIRVLQAQVGVKPAMDDFVEAIQGVLLEEYRSEMAARTLLMPAVEAARDEGWRQSGVVQGSRWLPSWPDGRNRPNHLAMNNHPVVPLGQPFRLVGEDGGVYNPLYPGDPSLPLGERINCRCTRVAVLLSD